MIPTILLALAALWLIYTLIKHDAAWRAAVERGEIYTDEQGHVHVKYTDP
jgi:hypothetical protein